MSNTRMVIVVRRDLNMTPGLLAAQAIHTAMGFIQERIKEDIIPHALNTLSKKNPYLDHQAVAFSNLEIDWIKQPYVTVLAVDTHEELEAVQKMVEDAGLPHHPWDDVIPSKVLEGRVLECFVGLSIGPADSDALRKVTGTLPLY